MKRPAILDRLRGVQKVGNGWLAFCPGHDDRNKQSVSVDLGRDGRTLLNCHAAGCPPEQIASAVNMTMADLGPPSANDHARPTTRPTLATFAAKKHLDPALLIEAGWSETERGLAIPYKQRDGLVWRVRDRTSLEPGQGFLWDSQKGKPLIPYGRWRLDDALERGELWLVEGESDTVTAWVHHLPCLGLPGNQAAKALSAEDLVGIDTLWIVQEPGQSGRGFLQALHARLRTLKYTDAAGVVRFAEKDLSDAHVAHGAALAAQIGKAQAAARDLWAEDLTMSIESATPAAPVDKVSSALPPINGGRMAIIVRASDVVPEQLTWLWPGRLAVGALTNVVGLPDQGKSLIYTDIAARVSTGSLMPPAPHHPGALPARRVLILTQEDPLATTVIPRLMKAGADLTRIDILQMVRDADDQISVVTLSNDLDVLAATLEAEQHGLQIVDGIAGYLGADAKTHNDADVRRVLTPFVAILEDMKVAGLSVMHPPKSVTNLAYFAGGSVAFSAVPRVTLGVAPDPKDDRPSPRRFLAKIKGNLYGSVPTLAYQIVAEDDAGVPRIEWEPGEVSVDLAAIFDPPREAPEERGPGRACEKWMRAFLADGPRHSLEAEQAALAAGFKPSTIRRTSLENS